MADEQKSLTWIVVVAMFGIAVFGCGFLAGEMLVHILQS